MTYEDAEKIVDACDEYIIFDYRQVDRVLLDGRFNADELEAFVVLLKHRQLAKAMGQTV